MELRLIKLANKLIQKEIMIAGKIRRAQALKG